MRPAQTAALVTRRHDSNQRPLHQNSTDAESRELALKVPNVLAGSTAICEERRGEVVGAAGSQRRVAPCCWQFSGTVCAASSGVVAFRVSSLKMSASSASFWPLRARDPAVDSRSKAPSHYLCRTAVCACFWSVVHTSRCLCRFLTSWGSRLCLGIVAKGGVAKQDGAQDAPFARHASCPLRLQIVFRD